MKPERSKNVSDKCFNKKAKECVNEVSAVSEEAIEDTINSVFKDLDISAVQDDTLSMKKTKKPRKARPIPEVAKYFYKITFLPKVVLEQSMKQKRSFCERA